MKKKILIPILIIMILIPSSVIMYPIIKNENYEKELLDIVYNNTDIKDIIYLNKDNNYYVIKTKAKVIVLDLNYEEKISLNIDELQDNSLPIVYRRNNLYYEEKTKEEEKLIYKFYDIKTNELIYQTSLGGI